MIYEYVKLIRRFKLFLEKMVKFSHLFVHLVHFRKDTADSSQLMKDWKSLNVFVNVRIASNLALLNVLDFIEKLHNCAEGHATYAPHPTPNKGTCVGQSRFLFTLSN